MCLLTAKTVSLLVESTFSTSKRESSFTSTFLQGTETSLAFLDFDFCGPVSHLGHKTLKTQTEQYILLTQFSYSYSKKYCCK